MADGGGAGGSGSGSGGMGVALGGGGSATGSGSCSGRGRGRGGGQVCPMRWFGLGAPWLKLLFFSPVNFDSPCFLLSDPKVNCFFWPDWFKWLSTARNHVIAFCIFSAA